ncbi:MAG: hypothetical protein FJZ47_08555 [Candidatus Tectomicrobia bacterium]|uniref:Uncharacterized protein n=1 Tax=Tectimicrobiota bacterium TaxID=2528274 RepID=A0A937W156_UNCTE|nr:hypothetical protein [Candidatus Tectomicrobia bacterium]
MRKRQGDRLLAGSVRAGGAASTPAPAPPADRAARVTPAHYWQARAALATTIEWYRAMAMTLWLPQAEAVLARVE